MKFSLKVHTNTMQNMFIVRVMKYHVAINNVDTEFFYLLVTVRKSYSAINCQSDMPYNLNLTVPSNLNDIPDTLKHIDQIRGFAALYLLF